MNREWKKHKYYAKVKTGKTDRYFYTKDEYDSFRNTISGGNKTKPLEIGNIATTIVSRTMDNKGILPLNETSLNVENSSWKNKGYKNYREYKKAIMNGKEPLPKKKEKTTIEEDLNKINPANNARGYDTQTNCAYCTLAFDMRRRGYDVVAEDESSVDNDTTIPEWYEEKRPFTEKTGNWKFRDLKKDLQQYPDNSYGQFCVYWKNGSGHSMIWYKEDGEIYIYDSQWYNYESKLLENQQKRLGANENDKEIYAQQRKQLQTMDTWERMNSDKVSRVMYLRTDDLTLNKKALKKVDYN